MAKIIQPLTNTQTERAKYTAGGCNELNDGNGLFLQLNPTGSKIWRMRYNNPITGKRTKLTIGTYPEISLAQARAKRDEYKAFLAQGIEPQEQIKKTKQERIERTNRTFLAIAEQWKAKKQSEIYARTLKGYWRNLEIHIFPHIGAKPISEIMPTDVKTAISYVEQMGKFSTAKRLAVLINDILNFAVNGGLIPFNPCLSIGKTLKRPSIKNAPRINSDELPLLLENMNKSNISQQTKTLFYFQLLTMVRPNEASQAEWAEIDFKKRLWIIPAERMKGKREHIVPLCIQAINLLKKMKPITGKNRFIFPSRTDQNKPTTNDVVCNSLRTIGYQNKQTAHGLRGLARTYLAEQNITHEHAEACLAHKTGNNVSLAYNHATYLEQRKTIMQLWADFVEKCSISPGI